MPKLMSLADLGVGPRVVGGRYLSGYWHQSYEVLAIEDWRETLNPAAWSMTVRWSDGTVTTHCTSWEPWRDRILTDED